MDSRSDTVKSDVLEDGPDINFETTSEIPRNANADSEAPATDTEPDAEHPPEHEETAKDSKDQEKQIGDASNEQVPQSQNVKTADPLRIPASHPVHSLQRGQTSSLNRLAIFASSQNKLPTSRLKIILDRVARPTLSSGSKRSQWYKNEQYVDMNSFSWKNLSLYVDYQRQIWTDIGTLKSTNKK
ncbi:uncharacterized protein LOC121384569 [Gigantopelta aegis]|uniref:uncharacterized protein LOC121384569 n=1 Tax=Gigantopelta aegis TaxID=1735272 RepID=UPI001B888238|nr:uncharacterized protein LOC121384569 [Gigantopelta aegis]